MNKPQKKDMSWENRNDLVYRPPSRDGDVIPAREHINYDERRGYNQACDDYEAWLPSKKKLIKWLDEMVAEQEISLGATESQGKDTNFWKEVKPMIAKTIYKRLRRENE